MNGIRQDQSQFDKEGRNIGKTGYDSLKIVPYRVKAEAEKKTKKI